MRRTLGSLGLVVGAIGCGEPDPCAEITGACLVVQVESRVVTEIDQLELDVLYGGEHGTTSTQPAGGGLVALPLVTAIQLATGDAPLAVGVVAAGKLSGVVLGTGAASTVISPDATATIELALAPPDVCVAGSFYCGGDKLAGDPQTLYQCNGGGVPLARDVCGFGCLVRPGDDDTCRGDGTCVEGSSYCGGTAVDGDPQTLYRCTGGVGTNPMPCATRCEVRPNIDDRCR